MQGRVTDKSAILQGFVTCCSVEYGNLSLELLENFKQCENSFIRLAQIGNTAKNTSALGF